MINPPAGPSPRRRRTPPALAALTIALLIGVIAGPALAAPSAATATAGDEPATVRVAHLSPDMPGVDVYLTSFTGVAKVWVNDATYGEVSAYRQVPPGAYTFTIRTHDAPMTAAPLQTWGLTAKPGYAYTAAVVGSGADHRGVVLDDNLTPPAAGHANVRLIQASSRAGTATLVAVDGPVLARNAAFGTSTGYASVLAGTWPLQATGDGQVADTTVSIPAGSVSSVLLLDAPAGGTRLTALVDAAGVPTAAAPKGPIDAGGGGTARHVIDQAGRSPRPFAVLVSVLTVVTLLAALSPIARRRWLRRPLSGHGR